MLFTGDLEELEKWLEKREKKIQKKTETLNCTLSSEETDTADTYYETSIFAPLCQVGTGVEILDTENNLPLSSWNLGKIRFRE
ncbi:hypothetical protein H6768_06000 [Candidatus Peribacteria bacterium]|nr:hypothetical protein [Candidatus Peribacteria bacterium]